MPLNIQKTVTPSNSEREKLLEKRIQEIEQKFVAFQAQFNQTHKGKGRGKSSQTKSISEQIDTEARKRLRSFLECEELSSASTYSVPKASAPPFENSESDFNEPGPSCSLRDDPTEKEVYIRKIEVLLNGSPIDQVEDKQTADECIQAYWRMFAFNGQMNSLFTNGIRHVIKLHCKNVSFKLFIFVSKLNNLILIF